MAEGRTTSKDIDAVMDSLRKKIAEHSEKTLKEAGLKMIVMLIAHERGFHHVTGNLINSGAVALYYNGKLKGMWKASDVTGKLPTRVTLAAGERYDLPYYWSGKPSTGYAAPKDSPQTAHYLSPNEADRFMLSGAPNWRGWSYKVVTATDYAKYVEARSDADVLTSFHSAMEHCGGAVSALNQHL